MLRLTLKKQEITKSKGTGIPLAFLSTRIEKFPSTVMMEPTNKCNLKCPSCPTGKGIIKSRHEMSLSRFRKIINELGFNIKTLLLWGYGEPMLHKDIFRMISYAKDKKVECVKISTNGHFLTKNRIRHILSSGLDYLIISLDGASKETYLKYRKRGNFERVVKNIKFIVEEKKRLNKSKPIIELQFIIMRHNEHEIPKIKELSKKWGVNRLVLKTVGIFPGDEHLLPVNKKYSRYSQNLNKNNQICSWPWNFTVINSDGSVNICCYLRTDMGKEYVMGNIFKESFTSIWNGEKYSDFRLQMLKDKSSLHICNTCPVPYIKLNYDEIDLR